MRAAQSTAPGVRLGTPSLRAQPGLPTLQLLKTPGDAPLLLCFCGMFLLGYLPGILAWRGTPPAFGTELAAWCSDSARYANWAQTFTGQLAAAFLQFTLILLCGFCAFGLFFLVGNFLCRGIFMGFCAAGVYSTGGAKALLLYWLLSCLPDLLILLLGLFLAASAAKPAGYLYQHIFGVGATRNGQKSATRKLLVRYLFSVLLAVPACAACSGFASLLAGLLL